MLCTFVTQLPKSYTEAADQPAVLIDRVCNCSVGEPISWCTSCHMTKLVAETETRANRRGSKDCAGIAALILELSVPMAQGPFVRCQGDRARRLSSSRLFRACGYLLLSHTALTCDSLNDDPVNAWRSSNPWRPRDRLSEGPCEQDDPGAVHGDRGSHIVSVSRIVVVETH